MLETPLGAGRGLFLFLADLLVFHRRDGQSAGHRTEQQKLQEACGHGQVDRRDCGPAKRGRVGFWRSSRGLLAPGWRSTFRYKTDAPWASAAGRQNGERQFGGPRHFQDRCRMAAFEVWCYWNRAAKQAKAGKQRCWSLVEGDNPPLRCRCPKPAAPLARYVQLERV